MKLLYWTFVSRPLVWEIIAHPLPDYEPPYWSGWVSYVVYPHP